MTSTDVPEDLPFVPEGHEPACRLVTRGAEKAGPAETAANTRICTQNGAPRSAAAPATTAIAHSQRPSNTWLPIRCTARTISAITAGCTIEAHAFAERACQRLRLKCDVSSFGWTGERDLRAALAFLRRQPDVGVRRRRGRGPDGAL